MSGSKQINSNRHLGPEYQPKLSREFFSKVGSVFFYIYIFPFSCTLLLLASGQTYSAKSPQAPFRRREAFQSQRLLGVRTACLPKPTANTTQQPTHSTHPLGAGAPEFSQSKAAEGSDLRPPHTFVPEPRRPPAGSARNPLDPTPPGTRGRRRGNTDKPPVSLKSRRKFWDSCFTACSLNNLMISRIVGNGGRRKVPSLGFCFTGMYMD